MDSNPARDTGTPLSDAQVAGVMDFVNNAEIQQAQLAQSKSQNPQVMRVATMMIEHHTQAKQRQAALQLSSTSSPLLQKLSSEGQSTLAKLRNESGQSFDRAYLQAQVDQHQKVLDMIDHKLLPSTQNSQLRSQIQNVRPTIQQHLQAARSALTAIESGQNEQGASGQGTGRSRSTGSGTEGPTQR